MHIHREMSTHVHYLPGTHTREQIFSELANAVHWEELYPKQYNESYSTNVHAHSSRKSTKKKITLAYFSPRIIISTNMCLPILGSCAPTLAQII